MYIFMYVYIYIYYIYVCVLSRKIRMPGNKMGGAFPWPKYRHRPCRCGLPRRLERRTILRIFRGFYKWVVGWYLQYLVYNGKSIYKWMINGGNSILGNLHLGTSTFLIPSLSMFIVLRACRDFFFVGWCVQYMYIDTKISNMYDIWFTVFV